MFNKKSIIIMRRMKKMMLAATLVCGTTTVLSSCVGNEDNSVPVNPKDPNTIDYSQKTN